MRTFGPRMSWHILGFGWGKFDILRGKQEEYEMNIAGYWNVLDVLEGFFMAFPFISQEPELLHRVGRQNLLLQIPLPGQVVAVTIATACPMIFRCQADPRCVLGLCTDLASI